MTATNAARTSVVLLAGLGAACGHTTAVAPAGAFTPSSVQAFSDAARATVPAQRQVIRISWHSDDGRLQLSGNGAARVAPPDSLRADIAGALGLGRGTVLIVGDSISAQPAAMVSQVLPDPFTLWAMLGMMRVPPGRLSVEHAEQGARTLWKVTDAAGRIYTFELNGGALMSVSREEGGRRTAQLHLTRAADGALTKASLTDVAHSLRLDVDITAREPSDAFPPETWQLHP